MPPKTPAGRAQLLLDAVAVILASAIALVVLVPGEGVTGKPDPTALPLPAADRERAVEYARRQLLALNTANLSDYGVRQRLNSTLLTPEAQLNDMFVDSPAGHPRESLTEARVSTLVVTGSSKAPKPSLELMAVVRGKTGGVDAVRRYLAGVALTPEGWRFRHLREVAGGNHRTIALYAGEPSEEFRFFQKAKDIMGAVVGQRSRGTGRTSNASDLSHLTGEARQQYDRIVARAGWTTHPLGASVEHVGLIRYEERSGEVLMFVNMGESGPSVMRDSRPSAATDLALKVTFVRVDGAWKISRMVDA